MNEPSHSDATALARHAAVSWIQEALKENYTLARATALASERTWGGKTYSASTLEGWHYAYQLQGFEALQRQPRKDKGTRKALSPEACQALLDLRRQYPQLKIKVLVRQLLEKGVLLPGTFSLPSVYRFLAAHQMDAHSIKHNPPPPGSGPTKAFECPLANELWMTDMMFGPSLKLASGRVVHPRLFALLDDCSRLIPHAQYYDSEPTRPGTDALGRADRFMNSQASPCSSQIQELHQTYCRLIAQNLSLRFDRERLWYEFLRAGFTEANLNQVVAYLQKEIRQTRRNVGALKLSNLLQLDRFEEDLNISRVQLRPAVTPPLNFPSAPTVSPAEQARGRQRALDQLHDLQEKLRHGGI